MIQFKIKNVLVKSTKSESMLTKRERDVLWLIAKKYTTTEIAEHLYLSTNTVLSHRHNLLKKLEARNMAGMIYKAFKIGELNLKLEPIG